MARRRLAQTLSGNEVALTSRQTEVLRLIADGKMPTEIGLILGIKRKTAAAHRDAIQHRLGIYGTALLVKYAIARGLVDPRDDESEYEELLRLLRRLITRLEKKTISVTVDTPLACAGSTGSSPQ